MAAKVNKAEMACNKPKRTPGHAKKSHIVKACSGGVEKIIRFGDANMTIKKKHSCKTKII